MSHMVLCPICKKKFDRDKVPCVQYSSRRYAHEECMKSKEEIMSQEDRDKEALFDYIMQLFKLDFVNPRLQKQVNEFITKYQYTYDGIRKALVYFYEIKNGDLSKANGSLGIVPYIYNKSEKYYYNLWMAQQSNKDKVQNINDYIPVTREIIITPPKRQPAKRNLFSFLDKEGEENAE